MKKTYKNWKNQNKNQQKKDMRKITEKGITISMVECLEEYGRD